MQSLAIVLPAFNEADGIVGFLGEISSNVSDFEKVTIVVVNDASTDTTASTVREWRAPAHVKLRLVDRDLNLGHGPSALEAYRTGLESGAEVIVHVDGDGQFYGSDIATVARGLRHADVVHGVRFSRTDPWFRKVLSFGVRVMSSVLARGPIMDVNTPLRAYRVPALRNLLAEVPESATVPHVHFSLLERRLGLRVLPIKVESIPRRGTTTTGSTWTAKPSIWPSRKLIAFARTALREVFSVGAWRSR